MTSRETSLLVFVTLFGTYCDCRDVFKRFVTYRCVHYTFVSQHQCNLLSFLLDLEMTVKKADLLNLIYTVRKVKRADWPACTGLMTGCPKNLTNLCL